MHFIYLIIFVASEKQQLLLTVHFWREYYYRKRSLGMGSHSLEDWFFHEFSIDSNLIAGDLTTADESSGDGHSLASLDLFSFIHYQLLKTFLRRILPNESILILLSWLGDLSLRRSDTCVARNSWCLLFTLKLCGLFIRHFRSRLKFRSISLRH